MGQSERHSMAVLHTVNNVSCGVTGFATVPHVKYLHVESWAYGGLLQ